MGSWKEVKFHDTKQVVQFNLLIGSGHVFPERTGQKEARGGGNSPTFSLKTKQMLIDGYYRSQH